MSWVSLLERLKATCGAGGKLIAASERRKAYRTLTRVPLKGVRANGDRLAMQALDLSTLGMRFECPTKLRKDEVIRLQVRSNEREIVEDSDVMVRVIWCKKHPHLPVFQFGTSFQLVTRTQQQAVARFLLKDCKLGVLNPHEKRQEPRAPVSKVRGEVVLDAMRRVPVQVRDLAVRGALLASTRAFPPNVPLDVRIFLPRLVIACKGEVVRQSGADGKYEQGVLFTKVPLDMQQSLVSYLSRALSDAQIA